jgi:hypothetical protein
LFLFYLFEYFLKATYGIIRKIKIFPLDFNAKTYNGELLPQEAFDEMKSFAEKLVHKLPFFLLMLCN